MASIIWCFPLLPDRFALKKEKNSHTSPLLSYLEFKPLSAFFFNEIKHRFAEIFPSSGNVTANTASIERTLQQATYLALVCAHSFLVIHYKSPDPDVPAFPAPTRDNGRDP